MDVLARQQRLNSAQAGLRQRAGCRPEITLRAHRRTGSTATVKAVTGRLKTIVPAATTRGYAPISMTGAPIRLFARSFRRGG